MKPKAITVGLALTLTLGASAAIPLKLYGQETTADASKRKIRTSEVPEYPSLAKQMNVSGKVKIEATVAADGHVVNTQVVGGSPLLVNSALQALKKWRFEPAPKETTEIVIFDFDRAKQK
jgi:TonB family protein